MTWKTVLAGMSALVLVGSTVACPGQDQSGGQQQGQTARAPHDNMTAQANIDIAAFKEMLRLTPEQKKNWPAFESALRDLIKLRLDPALNRRDQPLPDSAVERVRRNADALSALAAALKRVAEAGEPLYGSLDDGQRQRFDRLASIAREHIAMLERDRWDSMAARRGFDERSRDRYRKGDDEGQQRQAELTREMSRMHREMMQMHRDIMRNRRGEYEDRRGWRDRDFERWSDRDDWRGPYGRGMMEGRGGRDRYDDHDR